MFIFKNVKAGIRTNSTENFFFEECDRYIGEIVRAMEENGCDVLQSTETGEVVELHELRRMRGILSGLPIIDIMLKE